MEHYYQFDCDPMFSEAGFINDPEQREEYAVLRQHSNGFVVYDDLPAKVRMTFIETAF